MILLAAVVLGAAGLTREELPFRSVGQVSEELVPVIGKPLWLGPDSMGGVISPNGRLGCFLIAGVDYRNYYDVELDLRTGRERPKIVAQIPGVRGQVELAVWTPAGGLLAQTRPPDPGDWKLCLELNDARHLTVVARQQGGLRYRERTLSIAPVGGAPGESVQFTEKNSSPRLLVGGEPWRPASRRECIETVEARVHGAKILLELARIDLLRKSVTRRPIGTVPARNGGLRLQLGAVSMDGKRAILHARDVRYTGKPEGLDSKGGTYCWARGQLFRPSIYTPLIWRDRFIGSVVHPADKQWAVEEYTSAGKRVLATGWKWIAMNPDGSKVLAIEQASGKPYLLTFK